MLVLHLLRRYSRKRTCSVYLSLTSYACTYWWATWIIISNACATYWSSYYTTMGTSSRRVVISLRTLTYTCRHDTTTGYFADRCVRSRTTARVVVGVRLGIPLYFGPSYALTYSTGHTGYFQNLVRSRTGCAGYSSSLHSVVERCGGIDSGSTTTIALPFPYNQYRPVSQRASYIDPPLFFHTVPPIVQILLRIR